MVVLLNNVRLHNRPGLHRVRCENDGSLVVDPASGPTRSSEESAKKDEAPEWWRLQPELNSSSSSSSSSSSNGSSAWSISPHIATTDPGGAIVEADLHGSAIALPALASAHLHADKCYLLDRSPLSVGDFAEALKSTTAAKARFTLDDLVQRMQALARQCLVKGVTKARWFVEIDPTVKHRCLDAVIEVRRRLAAAMHVQVCAFAQDPIFTAPSDDNDDEDTNSSADRTARYVNEMQSLLEGACKADAVAAIGSAPYVEGSLDDQRRNIDYVISLALRHRKHVDFHIDYDLDDSAEPMLFYALRQLSKSPPGFGGACATFGHCTRLAVQSKERLTELKTLIDQCPWRVALVGLPTSDLFIQDRRSQPPFDSRRGTLDVLRVADALDSRGDADADADADAPSGDAAQLNTAISVNNCYNAFDPVNDADPLMGGWLPSIYQAGTDAALERLYAKVSTEALAAVGLRDDPAAGSPGLALETGQHTDVVVYARAMDLRQVVCAAPPDRLAIRNGRIVAQTSTTSVVDISV